MFEVNIYLETSLKGPGTRAGWYAAVVEYQTKHNGTKTREIFEYDEAIRTTNQHFELLRNR